MLASTKAKQNEIPMFYLKFCKCSYVYLTETNKGI